MFQEQSDITQSDYLADILPRRDVGPVRFDGWKPSDARGASFQGTRLRLPSGQTPDYYRSFRSEPPSSRPFNLPNDLTRSTPIILPGPGVTFSIEGSGSTGSPGPEGPPGPPGVGGGGSISLDAAEASSAPGGYTLVLSLDVMTDLYLDGSDIKFDTKTIGIYAKLDGSTLYLRGVDPTAAENVFDDWTDCT